MIQTLRTLSSTLMGGVVLIGIALYFVLGTEPEGLAMPPAWALLVVVAEGAAVVVLMSVIGYQAKPIPPGAPRTSHVATFQSGMIMRLSIAESTALIGAVLAFIVPEGGMTVFLVAAAISLTLMALHGYPWERPIERFREQLEREGGMSYLREDLGL